MLTPYPARSPVVDKVGRYVTQPHWSQWLTQLRNAVNNTPGNSVPVAFADLPTPVAGMIFVVTDSMVNTWGSVVTGGGGFTVGAFFNGTNWTVMAI